MAYRTTIDFWRRVHRGEKPTVYCVISTAAGDRAYAMKQMATDRTVLEQTARVRSFGTLQRSIMPRTRELINSYASRSLQHMTVTLDNRDRHFSKLIAKEPFLTRTLAIYAGFEDAAYTDHLNLFTGSISEVSLGPDCIVEADEAGLLKEYFYLPRAGRYSSPLNSNDRLPIVYGNLESAVQPYWQIPCIDTANYVYCYSNHASVSAAGGNTVRVWVDGVSVAAAGNWTYDESNDYESEGVIATITFTASKGNSVVTVSGQGNDIADYNNPVVVVSDLLVNRMGYTGSYRSTVASDHMSAVIGYSTYGVIDEDGPKWEMLQKFMGSFLGQVYFDATGTLVFDWANDSESTNYQAARIIPMSDVKIVSYPVSKSINLINRCPVSWDYNAAKGEFLGHDNFTTGDSLSSQGLFGVQEPKTPLRGYWLASSGNVSTIKTALINKFSYPIWELTIEDQTLKRADLDLGDLVALTVPDLWDYYGVEMRNQVWRIVSVSPDFQRGKVRFGLIDTGQYLTKGGVRDTTVY